MDLFEHKAENLLSTSAPLAARMRPINLEDIIGHEEIIGVDTPLWKSISNNNIPSFILWGPPGTGKT